MIELRTPFMHWDRTGVTPFDWPINRLESKALFEDIIYGLVNFGRKITDPQKQTHLKILATEISIIAHAVFTAEKIGAHFNSGGVQVNIPENYPLWNAAYNQDYSALNQYSIFSLKNGFTPSPYWKRLLRPLKYLNVVGFKRGTLRGFNVEKDIACITHCPLTTKHQKIIQKNVTLLSYDEWFYPPKQTPCPSSGFDITDALLTIAKKNNITVSDSARDFIERSINQNLGWVEYYLNRLKTLKIPKELWLTSLGNTYGRILAAKTLENGGKVVVHDHAEGGSFSDDIRVPFNDFQLATKFITFTEYQARHYKALSKDILINNDPVVSSISSSNTVFKMPDAAPALKKRSSKQVILYPCPLIDRDVFSPAPLMTGIEIVDWQCRLFDKLNKSGFTIHFKPHPLSKQPFPNYEKEFDLITMDQPFEEVMPSAEHILFDWTLTTTFGYALAYPVPITVIDFGIARYNEETRLSLNERCHWIEGITDHKNRGQTDWDKLVKALKHPKIYTIPNKAP